MKKYQFLADALRNLVWVGQLGLDLLMPLLLCVALCWWLNTRWGVGSWVYLPGFVLGLGGGYASAARFYRLTVQKQLAPRDKNAFNQHK